MLGSWAGQYKEELILNITVFVLRVWRRALQVGTDTGYYCVCCEDLAEVLWSFYGGLHQIVVLTHPVNNT
jgi:hypothetical protein